MSNATSSVARVYLKYIATRPTLVPEDKTSDLHEKFSVERYFVNDMYRDVTAVLRNGMAISCDRAIMHFSRDNNQVFRIRTIYRFRRMCNVNPALKQFHSYARQHGVSTEEIDMVEKELREAVGIHHAARHFTKAIVTERIVTESELENNLGCYFPEEDVLLVDSRYADQVFHPHSVRGRAQERLDPILKDIKATGVLLEIVDNDQAISSRFIHILGQTVEIRPRRDQERASGVYMIRAEDTVSTELKSRTVYMTVEEAQSAIGLYRTREEALTGGDTKLLISERVMAAEQELKELEGVITKRKHELELLRVNGQHQEHDLKSRERVEQAEFSTRKLERDDHYDTRSSSRRDTSESIKLSTVIIGAALTASTALAGWYFTNKKASSSVMLAQAAVGIASQAVTGITKSVVNVCSSIASGIASVAGRALSWLF